MNEMGLLPYAFWETVTKEELDQVIRTGNLNSRLCLRLWHVAGFTPPAPHRVRVFYKGKLLPMERDKYGVDNAMDRS